MVFTGTLIGGIFAHKFLKEEEKEKEKENLKIIQYAYIQFELSNFEILSYFNKKDPILGLAVS